MKSRKLASKMVTSFAICGAALLAKAASARDLAVRHITVQGEARKMLTPDQVILSFAVESRDPDVQKAQSKNNEAVRKVLAALKEFKIADKDMQTTYVQLFPQIQHHYPERQQEQRATTYLARKEMRVILRDLSRYEAIMTRIIQSGVNQIQQVQFHHSKESQVKEEVRLLALRQAKNKAQAMAKELGAELGEALSIQDGAGGYPAPVPMAFKTMESRAMMEDAGSSTLALGELAVEAVVTVSFFLK